MDIFFIAIGMVAMGMMCMMMRRAEVWATLDQSKNR